MHELSIVYELYRTVTQLAAEAGLHRVEALVDPQDLRSQNLLYGLDFMFEGVLHGHTLIKGAFHDDMVFALLAPPNAPA